MTRLPEAEWTRRADLPRLVEALGADNIRWVGGAVRDALLGLTVKDVDAATLHLPERTIELLAAAEIRAIPTGIEHGTVTAVLPEGPVEVTTLRHDVSTDGRRATVSFSTEWQEDAARRDFTINALYADPRTLEIFDWFGGLSDLAERRVRFIGDARQRIREDHLRILRYYRFQARFGSALDTEAEEACAELAPMLKGLSRERVAMELLNLLVLPDPSPTLARMAQKGVLQIVLPELTAGGAEAVASLVAQEAAQNFPPDPLRRLAALLPANLRIAEQVAARLRLSTTQRKRLNSAASRVGDPGDPRALAFHIGREEAIDRLLLCNADASALQGWSIPRLPLKGGAIVARGIAAGPEVARLLKEVEARWVAEGFPPASRVDELLDEVLSR